MTQTTAQSNRYHIGIFGRTNAGKSSLLNAMVNQKTAIVSDQPGTTTDVVKKAMEINGLGACTFLDTAGFDDTSALGNERIHASEDALNACDCALIVFHDSDESLEKEWINKIQAMSIPCIGVISHSDLYTSEVLEETIAKKEKAYGFPFAGCSGETGAGMDTLRSLIVSACLKNGKKRTIFQNLIHAGDHIIFVMPQDPQSPTGRLIQPQVMSLREALDSECIITCVTTDGLKGALSNMKQMPSLIVTDSQVFRDVYELTPKESMLTSFSVLMAGLKGDIRYFAESAAAISSLTDSSRVLIAECCTHAPMEEDIGRVKIPRLLRKKIGVNLQVDVKAGTDFPSNASEYDLIIQCGGCMFNRRYIMNRIASAKQAGVPMTNYGIAIAYLNGILEHVVLPEE